MRGALAFVCLIGGVPAFFAVALLTGDGDLGVMAGGGLMLLGGALLAP